MTLGHRVRQLVLHATDQHPSRRPLHRCLRDLQGYKASLLADLNLLGDDGFRTPERLFKTDIPIEPLLSVRAARAGCKIAEIPGDEPARLKGERKMKIIRWGLGFLYQITREALPPRKATRLARAAAKDRR